MWVFEFNNIPKQEKLINKKSSTIWDNRFNIKNNTKEYIKVLPLGSLLDNPIYKKEFQSNKKNLKKIPFYARKSLPAIFTLEGSIYIPHLNISDLNHINSNIDCTTIDFFQKKYDNII